MSWILHLILQSKFEYGEKFDKIHLVVFLGGWGSKSTGAQNSDRYISWIRRLYSYMAPYVSRFPRAAYINYRDLDIGVNNNEGKISYAQASVWGIKYFKNNFDRLVRVKTAIDPENFFRNEQSIPPRWTKKDD
ncbi:Berberine bridge enzyme-like 24 [Sesamum angolense]|uniref:Berberine bridge enzyme-like 24 n=1 Tax=Sesamum angolense TaxID=2727404 RepID=A0AAE1XCK8_9LAMI|nr:Berberine bridge enzyme-like 24 [Sesamum angolense]